jgi:hypothetical protein
VELSWNLGCLKTQLLRVYPTNTWTVTAGAGGFVIEQFNQETKQRNLLGNIEFDNGRLCFINKSISTESWPRDEGPSAALAIYDAINALIASTDSDGAKRATASVVLSHREYSEPRRGALRTIDLYIGNAKASILISDETLGKTVGVYLILQSK